jgi:hypothetical protein
MQRNNTTIPRSLPLLLLALLLALLPQAVLAQAPTGSLAEDWTLTVKSGHKAQFEAALRDYVDLGKKHNDPRPDTGSEMTRYVARSCCYNWADQDAYASWQGQNPKVDEFWHSNVAEHIESMSHYYFEMDLANSHWPENLTAPAMVGVTEFSIATGKVAQFHAARAELSQIAINQGWSAAGNHWSWFDRIGGSPSVDLAIPFENYADMASDRQPFATFLTEKMGAEKAAVLMEKISSGVTSSTYTIWVHRPDLSSSKD